MKRNLFAFVFIFACLNLLSQSLNAQLRMTGTVSMVNVNDTTYLRVLNGIVINNDYRINNFERVSIKAKDDVTRLAITGNRPLMMIELEVPEVEHQIDSVLYSRPNFIKDYKYPLYVRLPISINNKLVTNDDKHRLLAKMTLRDILKIEYLDNKHPKVNRNITPFGIINLEIDKKLKNR